MKCEPGYRCVLVNQSSGNGKIQQCVPETEPTSPPTQPVRTFF